MKAEILCYLILEKFLVEGERKKAFFPPCLIMDTIESVKWQI